jgi:hypothetical protein
MSFDLYFCGSPSTPIDLGRLQQDIGAQEFTKESRSDDGSLIQFTYKNPYTYVSCTFDVRNTTEAEGGEPSLLMDCYSNLGVSVSIDFLRPHFFALELMPMISRIANSSGLSIYDPQEDRVYQPDTPTETLIHAWTDHNQRVTQMISHGDSPSRKPYLSREKSLYWWQYSTGQGAMQTRLTEELYVPSIMLIATEGERVYTAVVWAANMQSQFVKKRLLPIPQVFPKCDYLYLSWGKDPTHPQKGKVPYSTAIPAMAHLLDDIDGPVEGLKILWPEKQEQSFAVFERLPKTPLGKFKRIASEDFVDVLPA